MKERRRAVGLRRQEDLAALVDVTQPTVSSWETGDSFPDDDKIPALAAALQCDPQEVLERAYNASYGTVGELRRNLRQILEWARRQELRFESVSSILEGMGDKLDQIAVMQAQLDAIHRRVVELSERTSEPPGPQGGNPHPSAPAKLSPETPSRLRR